RHAGGWRRGHTHSGGTAVALDSSRPVVAESWALASAVPRAAGGHHYRPNPRPLHRSWCARRDYVFSCIMVDDGGADCTDFHEYAARRRAGPAQGSTADVVGGGNPDGPLRATRRDDGRRWT